MTFNSFWNEYWYLLIFGIPLLIAYIRFAGNKSFGNMKHEDLGLAIEMGIYILIIVFVQNQLFPSHIFWIIGFPIFITAWAGFIYWILSKNDVYIIEATMQGEQFKRLKQLDKQFATDTKLRLLKMDKEVYDSKEHIGDSKPPFWNVGNRIKICDYFDGETFYHPEFAQLHNISFYTAKAFWLKMKKDLPNLIKENINLTWLMNYKIAHSMKAMKKNFLLHLQSIESQHEKEPFELHDEMDEYFEKLFAEKLKNPPDIKQSENESENKEKIVSESIEKGGD